jgi:cytidylate kinase
MTAIAIDGPAGAGKSTLARAVAEALGWDYVDSGAMYRAVGLAALDEDIRLEDEDAVGALAERVNITNDGRVTILDGVDVSERIRSPEVSRAAALVARAPRVRAALVARQRAQADGGNVVMEGRDIATHVLPDADVKVFLTASLDERARRRAHDLGAPDDEFPQVRAQVSARDEADETRTESPLVRDAGATVIDSTNKSLDELVTEVTALAQRVVR